MYDIVRKLSSGKKINFSNDAETKLNLESENSVFNLNCISASEFPLTEENFNDNQFEINWNWVKAHSLDELNNEVDLLARSAANSEL